MNNLNNQIKTNKLMKKTLFIPLLALAFSCKKKPTKPLKPEPTKPVVVDTTTNKPDTTTPMIPLVPSKIKVKLYPEPTYVRMRISAVNFGWAYASYVPNRPYLPVYTMKPVDFTLPYLRYGNGLGYSWDEQALGVNISTMKAHGAGMHDWNALYSCGEIDESFHPESLLQSYFLFEELDANYQANGRVQRVNVGQSPITY